MQRARAIPEQGFNRRRHRSFVESKDGGPSLDLDTPEGLKARHKIAEQDIEDLKRKWQDDEKVLTHPFLVAAPDSPAGYLQAAKYICDNTDAQVKISEACADAAVEGGWPNGEVLLAPGTYNITGTIEVGSVGLRGLGPWGDYGPYIAVGDIGNTPAVRLDGGAALRGVFLDGQNNDFACGVEASFAARVEDCYITQIGPFSSGRMSASTYECHGISGSNGDVKANVITYCSGSAIKSGGDNVIADNYLLHLGLSGIRVTGTSDAQIYGNEIIDAGDIYSASPNVAGAAIYLEGGGSTIFGNIAGGYGPAIYAATNASGARIVGNQLGGSIASIYLNDSWYVGIIGNHIAPAYGAVGILLDGGIESVISANNVRGAGSTSSDGIYLTSCLRNFISGNKVFGQNVLVDWRSGINIDGAANENNVVVGNDMSQGTWTTAPLIDTGTGTLLNYPAHATYGDNFT